jgi:ATP/maltotriose-dependent transcriptional regulator MalT
MDAFSYLERMGDYEWLLKLSFTLPLAMPRNVARFILDVLNRMPRQIFDENPDTWLLYGRCLLSMGRFEEAEQELRDIIRRFEAMPQTSFVLRVLCVCHMNLGFSGLLTCLVTGDFGFCEEIEKGEQYYFRSQFTGTELNQVSRTAPGAILCRVHEADPDRLENYIRALERSEPLLDRAMEGCLNGLALATRAEYAYYRGDVRACVTYAKQALQRTREKKQYDIESRVLFLLLRAALARGNFQEIQRILAELESLGSHPDYLDGQADYDIITGWYHLMIGQHGRVADWLLSPPDREGDGTLVSGFECITKIKYFLFQRRYEELLAYMESGQGKFGWKGYAIGRLELYAASAVALSKGRARERSLGLLLTAYEIAAPCGLDMAFIELGSDMRTLTAAALKSKDERFPAPWLEKINRRSAAYAKNILSVAADYRKANGLEGDVKLTGREIDILSDLYHGLSRSEIAVNRDLSINTVKSALSILYSKLGAENTNDAIRIALERKLM